MTADTPARGRIAGESLADQTLRAALRRFAEHGVAGTSLQDLADDLGVTKAAVYYHFRTKREIVDGLLAPAMAELGVLAERAGREPVGERRGWLARQLVDYALERQALYAVLLRDPHVITLLQQDPDHLAIFHALRDHLTRPDADASERVLVDVFLVGLSVPATDPQVSGWDGEDLRAGLERAASVLLRLPAADRLD